MFKWNHPVDVDCGIVVEEERIIGAVLSGDVLTLYLDNGSLIEFKFPNFFYSKDLYVEVVNIINDRELSK